jgi:hypothetical protein
VSPAIPLRREDFLDEIRVAPRWSMYPHSSGFFELIVFYPFATRVYWSPVLSEMSPTERAYFYTALHEIINTPSIAEGKVG